MHSSLYLTFFFSFPTCFSWSPTISVIRLRQAPLITNCVTNRKRRIPFQSVISPLTRQGPCTLHSTVESSSDSGWIAGNFTRDLWQLQICYNHLNAEEELRASQRVHILNEFAHQRRDLFHDIQRFLCPPIRVISVVLLSTVLFHILRISARQVRPHILPPIQHTIQVYHGILKAVALGMNVSFWMFSISPPLILAVEKIWMELRLNQPMIYDNNFLSMISLSMHDEDTVHPCSDYIACLLNQWISSISGTILFFLTFLIITPFHNGIDKYSLIGASLAIQFVTRIASVLSLHQFPGLLYQLQRDNQPRPIPYLVTKLQNSIRTMVCILPWGMAFDVLQILLLALESMGLPSIFSPSNSNLSPFHPYSFFHPLSHWKHRYVITLHTTALLVYWRMVALSMIPALLHIAAFSRICRVQRYSNVSLATNYDDLEPCIRNSNNDNLRHVLGIRWRYKLEWREPKTLAQSIRSIWNKFLIFMFSGWDGITKSDNESFQKTPLPKILSLVDDDLSRHSNAHTPDRNTWVEIAMEKMSSIHEKNYQRKNFEDPLGIALQQTLGIGLSFDFDHDTPLKEGEIPSVHRLRARAAKSAIKRFQEIPNELKEKVDMIEDADEKIKVGLELMESAQLEVRQMVHALVEFIPTNAESPEDKPFDIETLKKTDADLLPPSILSFELEENIKRSSDEAVTSYYEQQDPVDVAEDMQQFASDVLQDEILA